MSDQLDSDLIRIEALADVQAQPEDYLWRHYKRWYSKTFHTPLADVDLVPRYDILVHYWEDHFDTLPPEELDAAIVDAVRPISAKEKARMRDEAYQARIEKEAVEEAARAAKKTAPKPPAPKPPQGRTEFFDPTDLDSLGDTAQNILDSIPGIAFARQSPEG